MKKVLVTGAAGYIGGAQVKWLARQGYAVQGAVRGQTNPADPRYIAVGDITCTEHWPDALVGVEAVIHGAGKAHAVADDNSQSRALYEAVNVTATQRLLVACQKAGVKRFIYLSSIKVLGEYSPCGIAFTETTACHPSGVYATTKYQAEIRVKALCAEAGMDYVIIRPVLVYSAAAPANFARLLRLSGYSLPLPFGGINNRRSLLALDNLLSFVQCALEHPQAANETFNLADTQALSLPEILRALAAGQQARSCLLPIPETWLKLLGERRYSQLVRSFYVDNTKARQFLGWQPLVDTRTGLYEAAADFSARGDA